MGAIESLGSGDAMFLDVLAFLLSLPAAEPPSRRHHTFSHSLKGRLLLPDHCIPPPDSGALGESEERIRVEYRGADCGYSAYVSPTVEIIGRTLTVQPSSRQKRKSSKSSQESLVLVGTHDSAAGPGRVGGDCKILERIHSCAVKKVYTRVFVLLRVKDCKSKNMLNTRQASARSQWVVHAWGSTPRDLLEKGIRMNETVDSQRL